MFVSFLPHEPTSCILPPENYFFLYMGVVILKVFFRIPVNRGFARFVRRLSSRYVHTRVNPLMYWFTWPEESKPRPSRPLVFLCFFRSSKYVHPSFSVKYLAFFPKTRQAPSSVTSFFCQVNRYIGVFFTKVLAFSPKTRKATSSIASCFF
jgi:hypothetical protein